MRKARRRRARSLAFVVVTSLFSAFILASLLKSPASAQAAGAAGLRIIRSDASGVVFEFNVPSYQLSRREVDGERYEVLSAEGLEAWSEAEGAPLLPMRGVLVGAPQGAQISVHVLAQEVEELPQRIRLLPSPTTQIERPALETRRYRNSGVKYERNPEAYGRDAFTPEATARLGAMGYMRSQRFAQISLHPFQYNAAQGRARWVKQMRV